MNFNFLWKLMYFVSNTNDQSLWNKRVWFEHEQQLHNASTGIYVQKHILGRNQNVVMR